MWGKDTERYVGERYRKIQKDMWGKDTERYVGERYRKICGGKIQKDTERYEKIQKECIQFT